ncbi:hypothetical protein BV25DRAFT_335185 [Artomyces pyxidatus]|uniref:Uncharacterized protein n=1 Tax=Artomyces pyxidatus TaxID=48021 RepID=A0ACB8T5B2_9AGAM|nr:hypothetical protein BV25DRAFT_335185 [Artomyces pyxidatus]
MAQTAPPMQQQQMQPQMMPQPDPLMQALIEADFRPVDITLGEPNNACALCAEHSLEKCEDCDVDFVWLNRLSKTLAANPNLLCPPPPNLVNQKLSVAINNTKEEGSSSARDNTTKLSAATLRLRITRASAPHGSCSNSCAKSSPRSSPTAQPRSSRLETSTAHSRMQTLSFSSRSLGQKATFGRPRR